jgi:N-acyl homoserine lactone hydrolase
LTVQSVVGLTGRAQKVWALGTPTLTLDRALIHAGAAPGLVTMPCPSFLIQHERGLVLVDTGFDPVAAHDPAGVYGQEYVEKFRLKLDPEDCVDHQLSLLGVAPADIDFVVATHLHRDHAGGLYLFNQSRIIVGKGEIPWAFWPHNKLSRTFRQADFDRVPRDSWIEIPGDYDLFGDGSVVILFMPGHTPGSLSVLVRLPSQTLILSGDAVHDRAQLEDLRPLPMDSHTSDAVASIARIKMLRDTQKARLWICHDTDDWETFPHGDGAWLE